MKRGRAFRATVVSYVVVSAGMIATSMVTARRAAEISGNEHYLFTTFRLFVNERRAAGNEQDAALDAAFEDAGESTKLLVERPAFVLGFLDATGPVVAIGGVVIAVWAWKRRLAVSGASTGQSI